MTEDSYPKEYHFAIPQNKKKLIALAKKCLENDPSVNEKYRKLKELIKGDIDISKKNNISNTLENFFSKRIIQIIYLKKINHFLKAFRYFYLKINFYNFFLYSKSFFY